MNLIKLKYNCVALVAFVLGFEVLFAQPEVRYQWLSKSSKNINAVYMIEFKTKNILDDICDDYTQKPVCQKPKSPSEIEDFQFYLAIYELNQLAIEKIKANPKLDELKSTNYSTLICNSFNSTNDHKLGQDVYFPNFRDAKTNAWAMSSSLDSTLQKLLKPVEQKQINFEISCQSETNGNDNRIIKLNIGFIMQITKNGYLKVLGPLPFLQFTDDLKLLTKSPPLYNLDGKTRNTSLNVPSVYIPSRPIQ